MHTPERSAHVPARARYHASGVISAVLGYSILAIVSFLAVVPVLWGLVTSFKPEADVLSASPQWIPRVVTLNNYRDVLLHSTIPRDLANSLLVSGLTVLLTIVIAAHAAYAAARFTFRGRSALLFLILMTTMIPGIAVLIPMYLLAVQFGLYNTYQGLLLVYSAWQVPTAVWLLKSYFETIPPEIEDAARIDGCSTYRVFWQVVLPLARPGLAAAGLLVFVYVWNDFLIATTLVTSDQLHMISVGLYGYISQYGVVWGHLMAAVMVAVVPLLVLFAATQRQFVEGLSAGATK